MTISPVSTAAVSQSFERFSKAAEAVSSAVSSDVPTDTVAFTEAAVALSAAKVDVAANVRVFRAEQDLIKDTLDVLV